MAPTPPPLRAVTGAFESSPHIVFIPHPVVFIGEMGHVHFSTEQDNSEHELKISVQQKDETTLEVHLG